MPVQFDDDGRPTAVIAGVTSPSPRQGALLQYYNALRPYEQAEFRFVIRTIRGLFPNAQCDAIAQHIGGPIAPGDQADLSWGRLTNEAGVPLQNVQDWVCRLIIFGDDDGGFPTGPNFDLPKDSHFLSFTRRIAFPIRLYNRASRLPILIRGDSWSAAEPQRGIREGTAFSPYFCDSDFSSETQFKKFLERWLDPKALKAATAQQPETNARGRRGGAVRKGIAAGQALAHAVAARNNTKVQRKKSEAEEARKALETPQPRHANAATSAQPKPQQLPAPSREKGDSVEGRHTADAAPGTPPPKGPQSSKE